MKLNARNETPEPGTDHPNQPPQAPPIPTDEPEPPPVRDPPPEPKPKGPYTVAGRRRFADRRDAGRELAHELRTQLRQ